MMFADPAPAGPQRFDGPGPWFTAQLPGECSAGGEEITGGDTIRADGSGGWECQECVEEEAEDALNQAR